METLTERNEMKYKVFTATYEDGTYRTIGIRNDAGVQNKYGTFAHSYFPDSEHILHTTPMGTLEISGDLTAVESLEPIFIIAYHSGL